MNIRRRASAALAIAVMLAGSAAGCGSSGSGSGTGNSGTATGTRSEASGGGGSTATTGHPAPSRPRHPLVKAWNHHLPAPVSGEAVLAQGNDLLLVGGLDASDVSIATVTKIDPATGAARPDGELSEALHDIAATAVPGGVLAFGGGSATTTAEVQRLVPGGAGEPVGRLPVPRSDLSAVTVGGGAYVLGGYDGEEAVGAILRTSDGSKLETVANLPVPVRYAAVASVGPVVYAIGGEESSGADSTAIQAFDTRTGRAKVVGHLAAPLAHASAVVLGGGIYVLGSRLDGSTSDQILRLDPTKDTIKPAGRLPQPVQNAAATVVGGRGYLVGSLTPEEGPRLRRRAETKSAHRRRRRRTCRWRLQGRTCRERPEADSRSPSDACRSRSPVHIEEQRRRGRRGPLERRRLTLSPDHRATKVGTASDQPGDDEPAPGRSRRAESADDAEALGRVVEGGADDEARWRGRSRRCSQRRRSPGPRRNCGPIAEAIVIPV